ncbi:MAG: folylpolyglutamate synthase/dihydrofolate synthase family protein [Lachnospiraceae bacterium]|nr:folylpolyglutamate synthase/dihydrofolate synthase family protein [Lachnospiraceae bacterium]
MVRIMEYRDALEYLKTTKSIGIMLGLDRVKRLLDILGNPQDTLKIIHVAGTNGKGSVCNMTASVLTESGYRTGLFTSPMVFDFKEQFVVDGKVIDENMVVQLVEEISAAVDQMEDMPTEFEMLTAMAFLYFKKMNCEFAVIEVGMGGLEDATNIINKPEIAVIVNIDYDHMNFLGNDLLEIAEKKAGIIKPGCKVVVADQNRDVLELIRKICIQKGALINISDNRCIKIKDLSLDGTMFDYKNYIDIGLSLIGKHQTQNAAIVLEILTVLRNNGYEISDNAIRDALSKVHLPGRFDVISKEPLFIVDGSHNPHGIKALTNNLNNYLSGKKLNFITGILGDKDYSQMISETIPFAECYIVIEPDNPRALSASECAQAIRRSGFEGEIIIPDKGEDVVSVALNISQNNKKGICVFGSLYNVHKIMVLI